MWPEDGFGGAGESALAGSAYAIVCEEAGLRCSGGPRRWRGAMADRVRGSGTGGLDLCGLLRLFGSAAQGSLGSCHLDEHAAALHPGQGVVPALGIALGDSLRERGLGAGVTRHERTGDELVVGLNTRAALQSLAQQSQPVHPPPIHTILRLQERERLHGVGDQGGTVVEECCSCEPRRRPGVLRLTRRNETQARWPRTSSVSVQP